MKTMKKKMLLMVLFVLSLFQVYGQKSEGSSEPKLSDSIRIIQKGKTVYTPEDVSGIVYNEPFDILFTGIGDEDVFILASTVDRNPFQNKIFPIDSKIIFQNGNGFAHGEEPYELFVNEGENLGFNYFYMGRRIREKDYDIIPVCEIMIIGDGQNLEDKQEIYLAVFVDFNQNKQIEENEFIYFSLTVRK